MEMKKFATPYGGPYVGYAENECTVTISGGHEGVVADDRLSEFQNECLKLFINLAK